MAFNPKSAEFAKDFNHEQMVVVHTKKGRNGEEPIVAYTNDYKGKKYFHLRSLWSDNNGVWNMGKGLSVPADEAGMLVAGIARLGQPAPVAKAKKSA